MYLAYKQIMCKKKKQKTMALITELFNVDC